MAERELITVDEYRELFGVEGENLDDSDGSDIDFEGFSDPDEEELDEDSDSEEESEDESDGDEAWSDDLQDFVIHDFNGTQQLKANIPDDATAEFFFSLLFTDDLVEKIVEETNRYARSRLANKPTLLAKWTDTNTTELKAFFGISVIMGVNNLPQIAQYWSTDPYLGNVGIQSVMTKNRFGELSQYLHFNDSSQEPKRGEDNYDRLYKVRPALESVLAKIMETYEPSQFLSVDEGMIKFKGRLAFRQYMPAKPTKYGIKAWMAADSLNGYIVNFSIYLGKEEGNQRIHGLGYDVVMKMSEPFLNKNRQVFCDNFFTSTILFEHLLAQNTYACGTVGNNRKDLPPCKTTKLKCGETVQQQRGQLLYTKWHDKKDVTFLSTNVCPSEPARQVKRKVRGVEVFIDKPKVSDVYTSKMGGVDRADQLRCFYSTGWQSRRWYKYIFWYIFNLSVCNAFVLEGFYRTSHHQRKRTLVIFKMELAKRLINGFTQRKRKRRSLDPTASSSVPADAHVSVHVQGRKRKCVQCIKAERRTEKGYKVETRFECSLCKVALCRTRCHQDYHAV